MWNELLNFVKNYFQKDNLVKNLWNLFLLLAGTFVLSFGSALFLIPFGIVSGGMTGITILTAKFISPDVMSYILSWVFFVLGFIFLGVKFTISSLISTIFYPVFLSIALRSGIQEEFIPLLVGGNQTVIIDNGVIQNLNELSIDIGLLLIIGILGGALVGVGCSLTFHAGGSTGGLDILAFIVSKYTGIKESIPFFLFDGIVVFTGIVLDVVGGDHIRLISGFIGIITAFITSALVEIIYSGNTSAYMVDIISDKKDEILAFVLNELDRSATLFEVVGGYSGEKKMMIRVCFSRREYVKIKDGIAKIDPKAFCTFSQTLFVGGLGFERIKTSEAESLKLIKKINKKAKK